MKTRMTFEEWYAAIDAAVIALTGLGRDDLPDVCYADWYEEGISPAAAARRAIKSAKDDMGF